MKQPVIHRPGESWGEVYVADVYERGGRGALLGGEDSDGKVWLGGGPPAVVGGIMSLRMR